MLTKSTRRFASSPLSGGCRRAISSDGSRWITPSRAAMLDIAAALRLRTGQLVTAIDTLDEIAVRERRHGRRYSRPARNSAHCQCAPAPRRRARARLLEALRTLRYPLLKRMQEQLRTEVSALKLPRGISIDLPKDLGSDELTVSLQVRSGAELAHLLDALDQRALGIDADYRNARRQEVKAVKFDLDAVFVEEGCADSALATRVVRALPRESARDAYRRCARGRPGPHPVSRDPFGAGKRRIVIARRKTPFLMACPAGSSKFACCGYLVLTLASNCPMDCSYCFLQEYLADNPGVPDLCELRRFVRRARSAHAPTLAGAASASAPVSWRIRSRSIRSPGSAAT